MFIEHWISFASKKPPETNHPADGRIRANRKLMSTDEITRLTDGSGHRKLMSTDEIAL